MTLNAISLRTFFEIFMTHAYARLLSIWKRNFFPYESATSFLMSTRFFQFRSLDISMFWWPDNTFHRLRKCVLSVPPVSRVEVEVRFEEFTCIIIFIRVCYRTSRKRMQFSGRVAQTCCAHDFESACATGRENILRHSNYRKLFPVIHVPVLQPYGYSFCRNYRELEEK